jgi:hypothetical protein
MPTTDELEQEISDLREELNNTRDGLNQSLQLRTEETEEEILNLSHQMRMGVSPTDDDDDVDNMDELINSHLRDITAEQRPQMSSAGLEMYNKHFTNLTNHELHAIKKMKEQNKEGKHKTIMDESLGKIMYKCVNFLTFSFDEYTKKVYEAEIIVDKYENQSVFDLLQIYTTASILFIKDEENILYIGIILIFFSIIIYFINITTS